MKYSIGQFAQVTGLSIDTLRYYEKQNLISPQRESNNQRFYTEDDLNWIKFILRLKKTSMSIEKIEKYSELRKQGDSTIPERIKMLFEQLDILNQEQSELNKNILFLENKIQFYLGLKKDF